jgi:polyhydroxybutyrate depolymerase
VKRRVAGAAHGVFRRGLAVLAIAARISPIGLAGCRPVVVEKSFVEPTSKRSYRVFVRRDHDAKLPSGVLFALHAYATSSDVLPAAFGLKERAAGQRGFVVVIPEGEKDDDGNPFWNASRACCGKTAREPDDLAYLRAVLADVKKGYAVDPERVYALGVSNGAFMAHRWACSADDLRGIVAISGVGPGPADPPCRAARPVRVLQIHGDEDEVIRYAGGMGTKARYPSARETAETWAKLNGAKGPPVSSSGFSFFYGDTSRDEWSSPGADVTLWTFEGGEHNLRSVRFAADDVLDFLETR